MICQASGRQEEAVKELFRLCFPGEDPFADWFFRRIWRPEDTWLWRQGDRALAMMQLLPGELAARGRTLPAAYLYALGTHPQARGQGLAGRLLEQAEALCRRQGKQALFLIPQQPSLFEYYRRFGYRPAFWVQETLVGRKEPPPEALLQPGGPEDAERMAAYYRQTMGDRLCPRRDERHFRLLLENYAGNVWLLSRQGRLTGWAFLERQEEGILAAEALGRDGLLAAACALARMGEEGCLARAPAQGGGQRPFAMALPLTEQARLLLDQDSGYCNLLWN